MRIVLVAILLFSLGCARNDWHAQLVPAAGSIRINGEVPVYLVVKLHPVDGQVDSRESCPWGIVDDAGRYILSTYKRGDGAPPGEYRVTLVWPVEPGALVDRLKDAYQTPDKAVTTVLVTPDSSEIPMIQLDNIDILRTNNPTRKIR